MASSFTELYVVGPSSRGKTTLCNAVAQSLNLPSWCCITEVARQVMKQQGFTRADVGTIEMQRAIMLAQTAREIEVRSMAQGGTTSLVLSDRSGVDAIVYAVLTAEDKGQAHHKKTILVEDPTFRYALQRYHKAKFLLLGPVPEWLVDDGVRSLEQHERSIHVFREVLAELGIPYQEMGEEMKDLLERVDMVKRWCRADSTPNL